MLIQCNQAHKAKHVYLSKYLEVFVAFSESTLNICVRVFESTRKHSVQSANKFRNKQIII